MLDIPNMTLLTRPVVGAIAGFLASVLMGTCEGPTTMVVLGIVGAVVGGWVARDLLHVADVNGVNTTSILVATIGAIIVIALVGSFGPRRGRWGRGYYWR
jgi:uncharacterized membrane protein YeaQ/YmgE (transglycosylase-associated protein family)